MALVNFKKGYLADIGNVPLIDGQVLFTEDTNELFIDFLDDTNELKRMPVKDKGLAQLLNEHIKNLDKVENKSSEDIRNELTFQNVVAALGYTPSSAEDIANITFKIVDGNLIMTYPDKSTAPEIYITEDGRLICEV